MKFPSKNRLLESLPPELRAELVAQLEPVVLPTRTVIFGLDEQPRDVHFVTSGMLSIVNTMEEGNSIEVGLCGPEGFPEALHLLGPQTGSRRCFCQIAGTALRMSFKNFEREFKANEDVRRLVLLQVQYEALSLSQLVGCNRLHDVEERLARWLLMVQDRVGDCHIELTQEFVGEMLGTRRSSVSLAAGILQRSGLIEYSRGHIRIDDRQRLEDVACECYKPLERLHHSLYS